MKKGCSIGTRLTELRVNNSISQLDIATEIGMSRVQYGRLERDKAIPKLQTLQAISDFFGLSLSDILQGVRIEK